MINEENNKTEYQTVIPKRIKKRRSIFLSSSWFTILVAVFVLVFLFMALKSNLFLSFFSEGKFGSLSRIKKHASQKDLSSSSIVYGNFMLAERFFNDTDYENAIKYFKATLDVGETYYTPNALFGLAKSHKNLGNCDKATELLNKFISTYPEHKKFLEAKKELSQCNRK